MGTVTFGKARFPFRYRNHLPFDSARDGRATKQEVLNNGRLFVPEGARQVCITDNNVGEQLTKLIGSFFLRPGSTQVIQRYFTDSTMCGLSLTGYRRISPELRALAQSLTLRDLQNSSNRISSLL